MEFLLYLTLVVGLAVNCQAGGRDNMGTEFIIGFMENLITGSSNDVELFVTTSSNNPATVTVTTPLYNPSFSTGTTVTRGNIEKLTITHQVRGSGTNVENKGILITSTEELTVYGVNKEMYSTDGFVAFPTDAIGTSYILATWAGLAEFMVIATEDSTTVTVTMASSNPTSSSITVNGNTYTNGDTFTVTLNQYETFHALDNTGDFTGTQVTADKNITVFSGNKKVAVRDGVTRTSSDHLVEQMMPVETWGKDFFTISTPDRNIGDYFRVIASEDNTDISTAGNVVTTINAYEYYEMDVASQDYKSLTTSKPATVAMFGKTISYQSGDGPNGGDPQFSLIPPVPQFPSDYTFSTVETPTGDFYNYLVVVVRDADKDNLILDNASPSGVTWNAITGSAYNLVTTTFEVTPGSHSIYNTDPSATFLGMAFGNAQTNSYAYAAGTRLATINGPCSPTSTVAGDIVDNDCDGWIDEEQNNGIDDDGDGLIDEDLATPPRVDGNWADWGSWGSCSETCNSGGGTRTRQRTCTNPAPANNGLDCTGSSSETEACTNTDPCPIDGNWGSWTSGSCSRTCGNGEYMNYRVCDNPAPQYNGSDCVGNSNETHHCWAGTCYPSVLGNLDQNCTSDYFGCNSGNVNCVLIEKACDAAVDCTDGSDEDPLIAGCVAACSGADSVFLKNMMTIIVPVAMTFALSILMK